MRWSYPELRRFRRSLSAAGLWPESRMARIACYFLGLGRSEEHTSELQSQSNLVCRLLLEKKSKPAHVAPARTVVLHDCATQLVAAPVTCATTRALVEMPPGYAGMSAVRNAVLSVLPHPLL